MNSDIVKQVINFTVYGKAVPTQSARFTMQSSYTSKPRLRAYQPKRVTDWKDNVVLQSLEHIPEKPFNAAIVDLEFVYPWPKSWSKKKKKLHVDNEFCFKITRPDRDNLHKGVMDALEGKFWIDDSNIVDGRISKKYGDSFALNIKITGIDYPF